jgi:hypothetical protein
VDSPSIFSTNYGGVKTMKRRVFVMLMALGILLGMSVFGEVESIAKKWQSFEMTEGQCKILFPSPPNHWQHHLKVQGIENSLQYDLYVAANDDSSLYMMLIADFPRYLNPHEEFASLEGFMRGILKSEMDSQLLFIDKRQVQGHEALDFVIKSQNRYFKGRVIATRKKLYLLAVECQKANYSEEFYERFIESFMFFSPKD